MLKGKTKIELIDTRNEHIDTYENTNMFTNGIQELLSYTSVLDNNKFQSNINSSGQAVSNYNGVLGNDEYPTINYFTGGLLLLQDYVNEDADITSIPSNNKVIGRACLENNESTQNGSRNGSCISKEFINGKTYKYVWEFNETQANGITSCVSLTTPLGAVLSPTDSEDDINYPDKYPYTKNNFECVCDKKGNASNIFIKSKEKESFCNKDVVVLVDGANNCYYCLTSNNWGNKTSNTTVLYRNIIKDILTNKKILLNKYRLPYNNFSIFDDRNVFNEENELLDTIEIEIGNIPSNYFDSDNLLFSCNDENYLYLIFVQRAYTIYGSQNEEGQTISNMSDFLNTGNKIVNSSFIWKISLSDFSLESTIPIDLNNNIYTWYANFLDVYEGAETIDSRIGEPNTAPNPKSGLNDIYIYNNRLYYFTKENINTTTNTCDLVLCSMSLSDSSVRRVKYNNADIVIKQTVTSTGNIGNIYDYKYGTYGTFGNKNFSLSVPFVSMISDGNSLYITFIENKKTFVINDNTDNAYLINKDIFDLETKYTLSTPIYPNLNNNTYWDGTHELNKINVLNNNHLFYIVGGNGKILKLKNRRRNGIKTNNTDIFYTQNKGVLIAKYYNDDARLSANIYDERGCYDIIHTPTRLITINNLENQIEKKPYQKMRVTYTITEV